MHYLLTLHHASTFIPTQNTHMHLFFHHCTTNSPTCISNHSHPFNHSPSYHSHALPSILSLYVPSTTPINTLAFIHSWTSHFIHNTPQTLPFLLFAVSSLVIQTPFFHFPINPNTTPQTIHTIKLSLDLVLQQRGREECLNVHTIQVWVVGMFRCFFDFKVSF